jgi:hypothetical protein
MAARGFVRRIVNARHARHLSAGATKRPPLQLFRSLWGVDGLDTEAGRDAIFSKLKGEGYTGVETGPFIVTASGMPKWEPDAEDQPTRDAFCSSLQKHGLELIGMIHSFVASRNPRPSRCFSSPGRSNLCDSLRCNFACISPHPAKRVVALVLETSISVPYPS